MNNKELQALLGSLQEGETMEYEEQPLGKYGRMAMRHLHETNPQRFSLLKSMCDHGAVIIGLKTGKP